MAPAVNDADDNDLVAVDAVVDAIGKVGQQGPADGASDE
jgi:hypothetical protein